MPEEIPWKIPDKRSAFGSRGIHGQLRLRLSVEYSDAGRKEGKERPGGRQEERRSRCLWYRHSLLIWTYCLINSMNVSSASCCLPSTVCIPVFTIPPSIPPSFPPFIPSFRPSFRRFFLHSRKLLRELLKIAPAVNVIVDRPINGLIQTKIHGYG